MKALVEFDSSGVVVFAGDKVCIDRTIIKVVKSVEHDTTGEKTLCVTIDGLDLPFVCGYANHIPLSDVKAMYCVRKL